MIVNEELGYVLETIRFKTSIYRDKKKRNLSFSDDDYYSNILNEYITDLQQENARLKENNMSMQEEMARTWKKADLYKEVIEEVRKYTKKEIREYKYAIDETTMDSDTEDIYDMVIRNFEKLLQILDKAKD